MVAAIEMSISRTMISIAMASARIAFSEKLKVASERLLKSRKYGDTTR